MISYRDYSLRKRIATKEKPKKPSTYQLEKLRKDDEENSKLKCLEIDLVYPMSKIDWQVFTKTIKETQGLAYV